jgi:hypothetical protein
MPPWTFWPPSVAAIAVPGNDPRLGVAVFHLPSARWTFGTLEPSFTVPSRFVPKPTLYETVRLNLKALIKKLICSLSHFAREDMAEKLQDP